MSLAAYAPIPCPFELRPGTDDEVVWKCVVEANEYRLPDAFEPEDVVLDLGAHIGVFSHLACLRGSQRVVAFEAEADNYHRARANLARWGDKVELHQRAVWRSDRTGDVLHFAASGDPTSSAGGNVFFTNEGPSIPTVPLDEIVRTATTRFGRRVRFLKIDVESAEFPILLTSNCLRQVDEIAGEFHEVAGERDPHVIPAWARVPGHESFTIEALADHLRGWGFAVWYVRFQGTHLGLFFATRLGIMRWLGWRLKDLWRTLRGRRYRA